MWAIPQPFNTITMDNTNEKKPSFFRRYRWLLIFIFLVAGGGGYYFYQQNNGGFKLTESVSEYTKKYNRSGAVVAPDQDTLADIPPVATLDSIPADTVSSVKKPDSLFGYALPVYDTLPPIYADEVVIDSAAIADSIARLAVVPTDGVIDTTTLSTQSVASPQSVLTTPAMKNADPRNDDIFDGLLPTTYQSAAAEQTFLNSYASNTISTRGAYKLVTIAGKAVLLSESPEVLEMLNTLVEEEAIAAITVSDRQGRIVYASNSRERGRLITDVYVDLPVTNEAINWMRKDGLTITGIPVFSVGGRLGTVFVVTK